jgi:integrase
MAGASDGPRVGPSQTVQNFLVLSGGCIAPRNSHPPIALFTFKSVDHRRQLAYNRDPVLYRMTCPHSPAQPFWRRLHMGRKAKNRKIRRPKTRLGLPDLDQSKAAVLGSLRSPESQRGYRHAIDEFIEWYCSEPRLSFNRTVVLRYRMQLESRNLAPGTINVRLAAVRRLAYEAADAGLLSPELAAGIRRVKSVKKLGIRLGNWLSASEARALWQSPDAETLKGKRDRAIIAVLLGCGLRRRELADLTFDHLQRREDHWAIVDLVGKGGHVRTVPVPDWVKQFLDEWFAAAEIANGKLFRCVSVTQEGYGATG